MLCSPTGTWTQNPHLKGVQLYHSAIGEYCQECSHKDLNLAIQIKSLKHRHLCFRSLLRLGGGTWTHESSDLQSVPLATLVLQDSTGRGAWTHMQPITLSTVYKTEGICQYIGVLDGIWTHAIGSHNPLLYLTELLTQCWWKDSNFQLLPYESSLLPLKYINIYSLKTRN